MLSDAERDREVRIAVGEFSTEMSRVLQTLNWFTWQAAYREAVVSPTWVDDYDAEMKTQNSFDGRPLEAGGVEPCRVSRGSSLSSRICSRSKVKSLGRFGHRHRAGRRLCSDRRARRAGRRVVPALPAGTCVMGTAVSCSRPGTWGLATALQVCSVGSRPRHLDLVRGQGLSRRWRGTDAPVEHECPCEAAERRRCGDGANDVPGDPAGLVEGVVSLRGRRSGLGSRPL